MPKMVPRDGEKQTLQRLAGIWGGVRGVVRAERTGGQLEV